MDDHEDNFAIVFAAMGVSVVCVLAVHVSCIVSLPVRNDFFNIIEIEVKRMTKTEH